MLRRSVGSILFVFLGVLGAGVLIATAADMATAIGQLQTSAETQRLAAADKVLFETVSQMRSHRGNMQTALLGMDDPRARVEEIRRGAEERMQRAIATMGTVDVPERAQLAATLQQRWQAALPTYNELLAEGGRPRAERDLARTNGWYGAITATIDAAQAGSTAISNQARMNDPFIAELVQLRRIAWQVRDRYGLQCSLMRSNVVSGRPLDDRQRLSRTQWRAVVVAAWASLDELLARPGVPQAIAEAARSARTGLESVQQRLDQTAQRLEANSGPVMNADEWNALCQSGSRSVDVLANQALDTAIAYADRQRAAALFTLTWQAIAFLAALAVVIAGVLVIRRRFVAPIGSLLAAIARLGARDFATPVAQSRHDDEFGKMAAALESLRDNAATAQRLAAEQEAQQKQQLARATSVDGACQSFDAAAKAVIEGLAGSARDLRATATTMRGLAGDSSNEAATVAAAAERATANVQTVAAATEELSASVAEIARQVQSSAAGARDAVAQAEQTNATVEALNGAATRIGEVVKLISDIAGQTNLLALNATIEAARAGEAGKGFAVVANEVKSLANQTAKATDDIGRQVAEIQSATQQAVSAIRTIGQTIGGIDDEMTAIAAAVEEQGAATQEIARNVQQAATGTQAVTQTIGKVAGLSGETGRAGDALFASVETMSADADRLRGAVEDFLGKVRAA